MSPRHSAPIFTGALGMLLQEVSLLGAKQANGKICRWEAGLLTFNVHGTFNDRASRVSQLIIGKFNVDIAARPYLFHLVCRSHIQ